VTQKFAVCWGLTSCQSGNLQRKADPDLLLNGNTALNSHFVHTEVAEADGDGHLCAIHTSSEVMCSHCTEYKHAPVETSACGIVVSGAAGYQRLHRARHEQVQQAARPQRLLQPVRGAGAAMRVCGACAAIDPALRIATM
jgi:hypothetical protein